MRWIILFAFATTLVACATMNPIDRAITDFEAAAAKVQLGDPKAKVLGVLEPTQGALAASQRKRHEEYYKEKVRVEISYFRSSQQPDGITTDDEFTPYVFHDGKLVAIGWTTLGGPKTQAQPVPRTDVDVYYPYFGHRYIWW
jgi:hypothetical protein